MDKIIAEMQLDKDLIEQGARNVRFLDKILEEAIIKKMASSKEFDD